MIKRIRQKIGCQGEQLLWVTAPGLRRLLA
jgi:hypothetical protein